MGVPIVTKKTPASNVFLFRSRRYTIVRCSHLADLRALVVTGTESFSQRRPGLQSTKIGVKRDACCNLRFDLQRAEIVIQSGAFGLGDLDFHSGFSFWTLGFDFWEFSFLPYS